MGASELGLDLAKVLLAPVLLSQGKRVRREVRWMPEPAGPRSGGSGPLRLLVCGDSSGAGVGADSFDLGLVGRLVQELGGEPAVTWRLVARTGWTTSQVRGALEGLDGPFDVVLTALGVNDVTAGRSVGAWLTELERLLEHLRSGLQARQILVSSMPPVGRFPALPQPLRGYLGSRAKGYDRGLARLAARRGDIQVLAPSLSIDPAHMARDGFHPGPPVYGEWARRAAALMRAGPLATT